MRRSRSNYSSRLNTTIAGVVLCAAAALFAACDQKAPPPADPPIRIAVIALDSVVRAIDAKDKAQRVPPAALDPSKNPELAAQLEAHNRIQAEIRTRQEVLQAMALADRAAKAVAAGRGLAYDSRDRSLGHIEPSDFPDDPILQNLRAELARLANPLQPYFKFNAPPNQEDSKKRAIELTIAYCKGRYDFVFDNFHGTTFFADKIILPAGGPVTDITQAIVESVRQQPSPPTSP